MCKIDNEKEKLSKKPRNWLVTGCAGFIGSNILEELLKLNQYVRGIDNFKTGSQLNLDRVKENVTESQWNRFEFKQGDIKNITNCVESCKDVDFVLHQAALGSVPRSLEDPITTNETNISGFLNIITAAKNEKVRNFVYAASSSTYGDHPDLPKVEDKFGNPLSPYAVTKYVNELYGQIYKKCYDFDSIGLRYFNVFGPNQSKDGPYSAVIPKWIYAILNGKEIVINGDGTTTRDFTYIENVVQANILAATNISKRGGSEIYNVAMGQRTSLIQLIEYISKELIKKGLEREIKIKYDIARNGDVKHSEACIKKISEGLGYAPKVYIREGLEFTIDWFLKAENIYK